MVDKSQHIENIQDILMGAEMQRLQARFDALLHHLKEIEEYFESAVKLVSSKLHKKLQQSIVIAENKIDQCITQRHEEKVALRGAMYQTIDALEDEIINQQEIFFNQMRGMKASVMDATQEIEKEIELLQNKLEAMMKGDMNALSYQKVSREMMSQILLNGVRTIHNSKKIATHEVMPYQTSSKSNPLRDYIEHEKQELKDLAKNIHQEKEELYNYLQELKDFSKEEHQEIIDVIEVSDSESRELNLKSNENRQPKV